MRGVWRCPRFNSPGGNARSLRRFGLYVTLLTHVFACHRPASVRVVSHQMVQLDYPAAS